MTKRYTWPLVLAVALAAGCAPVPSAALPPLVVAVPGEGGVVATARVAGDRALLAVAAWQASDIDHVVLALHEGAAATPLVSKRIEGADLAKTIRLDGLKRNTAYRVVLTAFQDAAGATRLDDGEDDLASCTTSFSTSNAATVDAGVLALALRDRPDGVGAGPGGETKTSGSLVTITPGGQTGSGTEALSLVGYGPVGSLVGNGQGPTTTGPIASAKVYRPSWAAADALGGIYVADSSPRAIKYLTPNQTEFRHVTGLGLSSAAVEGSLAEANFSIDQSFSGLTLASGALFALQRSELWKIAPLDATGQVKRLTLTKSVAGIQLVTGPDGAIYVPSPQQHCVFRIDPTTGATTVVAGVENSAGQTEGAVATAKLNGPSGIAFAGTTMYIADGANFKIRKLASGTMSTLAGSSTTGAADGTGAAAQFATLGAITYANGRLYVHDQSQVAGTSRLREVTTDGAVKTVAGGLAGYAEAAQDPLQSKFGYACTLLAHPDGYLAICDPTNSRVRRFSY